jgi:nitroreductase
MDKLPFGKPIDEVIRSRASWRDYNKKEISQDDSSKLSRILDSYSKIKGPFGNSMVFSVLNIADSARDEAKKLGTYGMIRGAPSFIVGKIKKNEMNYEDFGYVLEHIILHSTELGLGTCWLGGTFNRSAFSSAISLTENETIPAITPVGYTKDGHGIIGSLFRWVIKAKQRKPWSTLFFLNDFSTPLQEEICEKNVGFALEMVRLAPSAKNKQPWRLLVSDRLVHFYIQAESIDNDTPKIFNFQRLDIGIALAHFTLALKEKNIEGKIVLAQPVNVNTPKYFNYCFSVEIYS